MNLQALDAWITREEPAYDACEACDRTLHPGDDGLCLACSAAADPADDLIAPEYAAVESARADALHAATVAGFDGVVATLAAAAPAVDARSAMALHHECCKVERDESLPAWVCDMATALATAAACASIYGDGDEAERADTQRIHANCVADVSEAVARAIEHRSGRETTESLAAASERRRNLFAAAAMGLLS